MKLLFLIVLSMIALVIFLKVGQHNDDAYNKHMCAVYGYQADCKTPLASDERLK